MEESQIIRLPKKYSELIKLLSDVESWKLFKCILNINNPDILEWMSRAFFNVMKVDLDNLESAAMNWKKWGNNSKKKKNKKEEIPQGGTQGENPGGVPKGDTLKERERLELKEKEDKIKQKENISFVQNNLWKTEEEENESRKKKKIFWSWTDKENGHVEVSKQEEGKWIFLSKNKKIMEQWYTRKQIEEKIETYKKIVNRSAIFHIYQNEEKWIYEKYQKRTREWVIDFIHITNDTKEYKNMLNYIDNNEYGRFINIDTFFKERPWNLSGEACSKDFIRFYKLCWKYCVKNEKEKTKGIFEKLYYKWLNSYILIWQMRKIKEDNELFNKDDTYIHVHTWLKNELYTYERDFKKIAKHMIGELNEWSKQEEWNAVYEIFFNRYLKTTRQTNILDFNEELANLTI